MYVDGGNRFDRNSIIALAVFLGLITGIAWGLNWIGIETTENGSMQLTYELAILDHWAVPVVLGLFVLVLIWQLMRFSRI